MYNPWDVPMALGLTPLKLNTYFQRSEFVYSSQSATSGHLENNFMVRFIYWFTYKILLVIVV